MFCILYDINPLGNIFPYQLSSSLNITFSQTRSLRIDSTGAMVVLGFPS